MDPAKKIVVVVSLTQEQLNVIGKALFELPYKESAAMISELQRQFDEQNPRPPAETK